MFRTIHITAAGVVVGCLGLCAASVDAGGRVAGVPPSAAAATAGPEGSVNSILPSDSTLADGSISEDTFASATDELPAFVWTSDISPAPPPSVAPVADDGHFAPPSATATAIPLPPAAWTGLATMAGLGAIAAARRLRRR